jgi:hypothetical protein
LAAAVMRQASDTFGAPNSRAFRSPTRLRLGYCGSAGIHAYGSFGTFGINLPGGGNLVDE